MLVKLVMGDWSGDGHDKTQSYFIESNLTTDEINQAFADGCQKNGVDVRNFICEEYEDSSVPQEFIKSFEGQIDFDELLTDDGDEKYSIWRDEFVKLFLEIAKLGNPAFVYRMVNIDALHIGGYGLFY